ncbi:MAG: hypothetical protein LJF04_17740 [Gemmatimonadetes bacterium]|nr:hypothetical protein [Gemmatimonadota bacterium]
MQHPSAPSLLIVLAGAGVIGLGRATVAATEATPAAPSVAAMMPLAPSDSSDLVKEAHDRQKGFEQFRESRIPVEHEDAPRHSCDQQIGHICIWFGGDEEADFPPELPQVDMARRELIGFLLSASHKVQDPWITGQLVQYLTEVPDYPTAERVARNCRLTSTWWCSALLGYVLHLEGRYVDAEKAFDAALPSLPKYERERWITPRYILNDDEKKDFEKAEAEGGAKVWNLFWKLSDPLYLVPGNDRLTDHFARWVQAENRRDAANPQALYWDDDFEATLIRYGRIIGWSRTFNPERAMREGLSGGKVHVVDTREVLGHHSPGSRGYLFPERFLRSPSDIPPESWITAPRKAWTWYAPPYAPSFHGLDSQVGRFRRADSMLVVGAYEPETPPPEVADAAAATGDAAAATGDSAAASDSAAPPPKPEPPVRGPVLSGLFLVPVDGGDPADVRGTEPEGVFTLKAKPGKYVSSLEVLDQAYKRAWRARQGVRQDPLVPGLVAVSDLMLLEPGASLPSSLDEAIPHMRRNVRIHQGEKFTVVWEVYGLDVKDPAQVTLGFTKGLPGFLTRVGQFLGVLKPDRPVEISFSDTNPNAEQTLFRAVDLELPNLQPGEYTLHLRIDLPGREPSYTSRPIEVVE